MSSKLDLISDVLADKDITAGEIEQLTEQLTKIKEIAALDARGEMAAITKKWENKISGFLDKDDQKSLALILGNVHRQITSVNNSIAMSVRNFSEEKEVITTQIDFLNQQLGIKDISPAKRKLLQANINQLTKSIELIIKEEHEENINNTFQLRGVNIYDEIVKAYDLISLKSVFGTQVMGGPVGLAYVMRLKRIVQSPPDNKNDGDFYCDALKQEVGFTIEQKEVMARTTAMRVGENEKLTAQLIANHIESLMYKQIKDITPDIRTSGPLDYDTVKIYVTDLAHMNRIGSANYLLCRDESFMGFLNDDAKKYINDEDITIIHSKYIPEREFVFAYKGPRESDAGIVWAPYMMVLMASSGGKLKFMTRNAFGALYGAENYFIRGTITE